MSRYIVCMIPFETAQYNGYHVLGVYATSRDDAEFLASQASPDHYPDDCVDAESFATWYPRMHARFQSA